MKRFITVIFAAVNITAAIAQDEYLPAWKEGYLDIHSIATGKGDCTLVMMPDGTTMLIDAGDARGSHFKCEAYPDSSRTPAQWMAEYIKHFTGSDHLDYFLLTHFHADHFGHSKSMVPGPHYGLCGVMELGEYIHFGKIVDRGYPDYDFPSYKANVASSKSLPDYIKFVRWQCTANGTKAEKFIVGSHSQFKLLRKPSAYRRDFDVFNVAASSEVSLGRGLRTRKMYGPEADPLSFDENMNSCVIKMRYGKFSYYNGGDLSGARHTYRTPERDWESVVADVVGPVTAMKADHHSWNDVMNPYFLWVTRPDVIIVQCSHINHPGRRTMERILDPHMPGGNHIYLTTDSGRQQVGEELFSKVKGVGHIVIRVYEGGDSYQVFVLDNRSTDYRVVGKSERKSLNAEKDVTASSDQKPS